MLGDLRPDTYQAILESLPAGVCITARDRKILVWSSGAEELTGHLRQEMLGRPYPENLIAECGSDGSFLLLKNGGRIPVSSRTVFWRDDSGSVAGDIHYFERRQPTAVRDGAARKLSPAVAVDLTTGLPNRQATESRLDTYFSNYQRHSIPFGILMVVLDGVDRLLRTDGRNAVETALQVTGQTLVARLGAHDFVGHWSGERFLAVVGGCTEPALKSVAQQIKRLVELQDIPWWGDRLTVTVSIGTAMAGPGVTTETLVERAEAERLQPA